MSQWSAPFIHLRELAIRFSASAPPTNYGRLSLGGDRRPFGRQRRILGGEGLQGDADALPWEIHFLSLGTYVLGSINNFRVIVFEGLAAICDELGLIRQELVGMDDSLRLAIEKFSKIVGLGQQTPVTNVANTTRLGVSPALNHPWLVRICFLRLSASGLGTFEDREALGRFYAMLNIKGSSSCQDFCRVVPC